MDRAARGRGVEIATAAAVGLALVVGTAGPALAATLSLAASKTTVEFGETTTLSGAVSPAPPPGTTVEIVDADAPVTVLVTAPTDGGGSFAVDLAPERNIKVAARVGPDQSPPVQLLVRPRLTAHLGGVRLFGTAVVSGHLQPDHPGAAVKVTLFRGDRVAGRADAQVSGSAYSAEFDILRPGRYRADAEFDDADHEPAGAKSEARRVSTPPSLHAGSHGRWVAILEQRLRDLHYRVPKPTRGFDHRTGDAVLAFHKVQGMRRVETAGRATWKRLGKPRTPKPRSKGQKVHIEIDQSKQVLYVVRKGEIDEIVHTSTGAGGATRDGVFHVHRKIAGFSPGRLYYPSYFDGLRAVHGWPDVPPTNASHGCSRVPYWTAEHLFAIMGYGMEVRVYH
ncbi:MAG: L,D-transpeptidase [Actinomycetota bacterium]